MGLDLGIRSGKSAAAMTRDLRQYLQHPDKLFRRVRDEHGLLKLSQAAKDFHPGRGVYRSSYMNARRLAATETNIAYRTADHLRWQKMDFVVGIEIVLSNNHTIRLHPGEKTSDLPGQMRADGTPKTNAVRTLTDICDTLAGRYPKDFKFTGWHPHCRCRAVTILKTEEEMARDTQRILEGKQPSAGSANAVTDTPEAFKGWVENNRDRIKYASSVPYFIRDNAKFFPESFINSIGTLKMEQTEVKAISVKGIALKFKNPTFVSEKEVKTALIDFAAANPSLFNGGLVAVKITNANGTNAFMRNGRAYYRATGAYDKKGNTITIANKDFALASGDVFNPLHEVKGAMKAIAEKQPLTFNQEYALESIWHEIRHAAAVGWKDRRRKTPELSNAMEVINQFCARMSYPSFIRGLGGKATHTIKVMEKGYGYSQSITNFNTLLKHMKVSKKAAYKHFGDMIIQKPYEDIYGELVKFVEQKGKYDNAAAQEIIKSLKDPTDKFQMLL